MNEEPKLILIVRRDLKMRRGKEIGQAVHIGVILSQQINLKVRDSLREWEEGIHKTIVLQCDNLQSLNLIASAATLQDVKVNFMKDLGLTEFDGPTITCLALGPDYAEKLDPLTKHLRLY